MVKDTENSTTPQKESRTAGQAGWHVSHYNVMAQVPNSSGTVIYNTYKRSCAEYSSLEMFLYNSLEELDENHPIIERFAKQGIIANFDERAAFETKRRLDCATAENGDVAITICPTMTCNFECPYCFSNLGRGKMSPDVQDHVVALTGRMLDAARAKTLIITWFGGEPLLACDVIESLSQRLIALAKERGCTYKSWIFTNGYLITQDVVDMLGRCQIDHVHIPLDGVGQTNDATRRLVGGGPTFNRIIQNLDLLKPPIRTLIRANTHEGNVSQLDELKALVLKRAKDAGNKLSFYVASLIDVSAADDLDNPMAHYAYRGSEVVLRPEFRGIPVGVDHACVAQNLWRVAIDDEGYLYKCGGKLCGQPEFAYATAEEWDPAEPLATATNPDMLSMFLNTTTLQPDDKCYDCVWLPLCGGGCPQLRLFGKHTCPAYRSHPEAFVFAMHSRMSSR